MNLSKSFFRKACIHMNLCRMLNCSSFNLFTFFSPDFLWFTKLREGWLICKYNLRPVTFLIVLAHFSLLCLCISDKRGFFKGCNLYKPCSFNLLLTVADEMLIFCLVINVDISVEEVLLSHFAVVIIVLSSFSEVFLFLPIFSWSWTSPVSWYPSIYIFTVSLEQWSSFAISLKLSFSPSLWRCKKMISQCFYIENAIKNRFKSIKILLKIMLMTKIYKNLAYLENYGITKILSHMTNKFHFGWDSLVQLLMSRTVWLPWFWYDLMLWKNLHCSQMPLV